MKLFKNKKWLLYNNKSKHMNSETNKYKIQY